MARDPRAYDAEVLDAAANVLRRAHRRREHRATGLVLLGFWASLLLVAGLALVSPAAPLVALAALLFVWVPWVARTVDGDGPPDPPAAERIPRTR